MAGERNGQIHSRVKPDTAAKAASDALCHTARRIYQDVLCFQNVIRLHGTRACRSKWNLDYSIRKVRPFSTDFREIYRLSTALRAGFLYRISRKWDNKLESTGRISFKLLGRVRLSLRRFLRNSSQFLRNSLQY
jgi:hypothetical protein